MHNRIFTTPAGVRLGPLEIIEDGKARNFVLEIKEDRFHGFILREGDQLTGYVDQCPHMAVPLAKTLDDYLTPDGTFISCSWHGALFKKEDGLCVGGPCTGQSLRPWPVKLVDGMIYTV